MSADNAMNSGSGRRRIVAGIVGNVLEWYDFAVYGYFATTIGKHFFPSDDPTTSVIAAFGAFAAGFLMRPFGSVIFGHIGDKMGRNTALVLSVALMALPTFLIGVLPDHATIGAAAAVLLVILRMLQGLSVGGEYTTSVVYLVENAPDGRRSLTGSWSLWGAVAGILLGSAVGAILTNLMDAATVEAWGWRIPFLIGISIGLVGFFLRRQMDEEEETAEEFVPPKSPIREAFRDHFGIMLKVAGLSVVMGISFYMMFVYAVTWFKAQAHLPAALALDINTANMAVLLIAIPLGALVGDRFGRKPVMMAGLVALILFSYPLFALMHHQEATWAFCGQLGFAVILGLMYGPFPAAIVEIVPPRVRVTVLSVGYNFCLGAVGGTTPMVAAYLIERTHDDLSPAYYLIIAAVISLAVLYPLKEMAGRDLKNWD